VVGWLGCGGAWGSEMVEKFPTMVVEDRQPPESERGCCRIWPQELPATSKHVFSLGTRYRLGLSLLLGMGPNCLFNMRDRKVWSAC